MKAFSALIFAVIFIVILLVPISTGVLDTPTVGVKVGNWIEYNISITGVGTPPPTHDVRWLRIEILSVQDASISANFTTRYANGTIGSAVWKYNFTEGNVGGWTIIPSNLSPGDTFYDSAIHTGKPINVTIKDQEQKTVLGASRTITYGNDNFRHKEWDKLTGVFVYTSEVYRNVTTKDGYYVEDLTVTVQAISTNMWSSEAILGLKPMVFYALVTVISAMGILTLLIELVFSRKKSPLQSLNSSSQKKIVLFTIIMIVLIEIFGITLFPFYLIGLSFAEINLIIQTFWTALVLISIWFRRKGHYFLHEILLLIVTCAWIVGFSAVLFMNPFSTSTAVLSTTTLRWIMNALHGVFSIPALLFSLWLVTLWRPNSPSFPTKSRKIVLLLIVFWVPSYIVGFIDFMLLHSKIFG